MKFQLVTIALNNATKASFNLGSYPVLNGANIQEVQAYDVGDFTQDENGIALLTADNAKKCFLTLSDKSGKSVFENVPYNELNRRINGGISRTLKGTVIDWTTSKLAIQGGTGSTDTVALLGVWYY